MSKVYILVKQDFRDKKNIAAFDTEDKARAYQIGLELYAMESDNLCGIMFYIEEFQVV